MVVELSFIHSLVMEADLDFDPDRGYHLLLRRLMTLNWIFITPGLRTINYLDSHACQVFLLKNRANGTINYLQVY